MKKVILVFFLSYLVLTFIVLFPTTVFAKECNIISGAPPIYFVHCGQDPIACPCEIADFFKTLIYIYRFIVWYIATPLAVIAITVGAIFMLISAGNPNLFGTGKKILYAAIIGLVLVFASFLIINTIVSIIANCPGSGAPICNWASIF